MTVSFTVAWHHYSTPSKTQKKSHFLNFFPFFLPFFQKKFVYIRRRRINLCSFWKLALQVHFIAEQLKKNQIGNCQEGLLPAFLIDFLREAHRWQKKTLQKSQLEIKTKSGRFQTCVTFQRKTLSLFRIKTPEKNAPVPEPVELFPRPDFQECKIKTAEIAQLLSYQKFALQTFVSTAVPAGSLRCEFISLRNSLKSQIGNR